MLKDKFIKLKKTFGNQEATVDNTSTKCSNYNSPVNGNDDSTIFFGHIYKKVTLLLKFRDKKAHTKEEEITVINESATAGNSTELGSLAMADSHSRKKKNKLPLKHNYSVKVQNKAVLQKNITVLNPSPSALVLKEQQKSSTIQQLSKKETDKVNQRLRADTMRRKIIKADRQKHQLDLAIFEAMNLFNKSSSSTVHVTEEEDINTAFLIATNHHHFNKKNFPTSFETDHPILIM